MIESIKRFCLNSLTVAWSYLLAVAGTVLELLDLIANVFDDPTLKDTIGESIGDPKTIGRVLLFVSVVTLIARIRSITRSE